MADTIGQFFKQPTWHSQKPAAELQKPPVLGKPAPVTKVIPPPTLSTTSSLPFEPAPPLQVPQPVPFQQAPMLGVTGTILFTPAPDPSLPTPPPDMPAPALALPKAIDFQSAPQLGAPAALPEMPAPALGAPVPVALTPVPGLSAPHFPKFLDDGRDISFSGSFPDVHPGQQALPKFSLPHLPRALRDDPFSDSISDVHPGAQENSKILLPHLPEFGAGGKDTAFSGSFPDVHPGRHPTPELDQIHLALIDRERMFNPEANPLSHDHPGSQSMFLGNGAREVAYREPRQWPEIPFSSSVGAQPGEVAYADPILHTERVMRAEERGNLSPSFQNFMMTTRDDIVNSVKNLSMNVDVAGFNVRGNLRDGVTTDFDLAQRAKQVKNISLGIAASYAQKGLNLVGNFVSNQVNTGISSILGSKNPFAGTKVLQPTVNDYIGSLLKKPEAPRYYSRTDMDLDQETSIDPVFTYATLSSNYHNQIAKKAAADTDYALNSQNNWGDAGFYSTVLDSVANPADQRLIKAFTRGNVSIGGGQLSGFGTPYSHHPPNVFSKSDAETGFVVADEADKDLIVPLIFTDMRSNSGEEQAKSVVFQPFISSLQEQFAPRWNFQSFFGRVDPVATYQSTNRTINICFKVVAFERADVDVIFKKLGWLSSMVYPEYDGFNFKSGPIIRMRVGNLISKFGVEGITGVITNLSLSYDQSIWELDQDAVLPRNIEVAMSFQVIHENPVGLIEEGGSSSQKVFGGIRRFGDKNVAEVGRFRGALGYANYLQATSAGNTAFTQLPQIPDNSNLTAVQAVIDHSQTADASVISTMTRFDADDLG